MPSCLSRLSSMAFVKPLLLGSRDLTICCSSSHEAHHIRFATILLATKLVLQIPYILKGQVLNYSLSRITST